MSEKRLPHLPSLGTKDRRQCWHHTPNRASRHNLYCRDLPPPGPPNLIYRSPYVGSVTFWLFVVFCAVISGLLTAALMGWHP